MSVTRAPRRALAFTLVIAGIAAFAPISVPSVHAATDRLRLDFDGIAPGTVLPGGTPIPDLSGLHNDGVIATSAGGSVVAVANGAGSAIDFPNRCTTEPCPKALVQIADHASLDPLTADFEWGARILLRANETDDGENILQKGLYAEVGGQWKLQVDKSAGVPSCVVSGKVPGQTTTRRVVLMASIGVADGQWHQVTCRRTAAAGVQIIIDDRVRGTAAMALVRLDNSAPVTIGNKYVDLTNTDQFHGAIDDAFMTVLDNGPVPNASPTAAFTSSCVDLVCSFDGSTSTDDGALTYAWTFDDASTDTGPAVSHAFAAGDHVVTLTVTDNAGLTSSVEHTVTAAENAPPSAQFTASCVDLTCAFDASPSTDSGPLTYAWDFGDGGTGAGVTAARTYAAAGSFTVGLTVTDAFGATSTVAHPVTVTKPAVPITFVGRSTVSANVVTHTANVPTTVRAGDALLMFFSVGTNATVKAPAGVTGWAAVDTLSATNGSTRVWRKVATAADAGAQVRIGLSVASRGNITIAAYRGTSTSNPIATVARSLLTNYSSTRTTPMATVTTPGVVVSYWMHRDSTTTALTAPPGVTVRASSTQSGGGRVTVLTADSGTTVAAGPYGGLTARASAASGLGTAWTIVLAPA